MPGAASIVPLSASSVGTVALKVERVLPCNGLASLKLIVVAVLGMVNSAVQVPSASVSLRGISWSVVPSFTLSILQLSLVNSKPVGRVTSTTTV